MTENNEKINLNINTEETFVSKFKEYYFKIPELIRTIFWALIIIIPFKLFIISPHMVVGSSMVPNFEGGDYLLVSKVSTIERGDILAIKPPKNDGFWATSYLKRLIALPGETIRIKDKEVYIKKKNSDKFIKIEEPYVNNHGRMSNMEVKLANDEYFVMGDNRGASLDSRILGPFKVSDLVGEPVFRVFGFRKKKNIDTDASFKLFFDNHPATYRQKI